MFQLHKYGWSVLWRFSKIKTLEVREISAPTITWKLEVGIVTVFSTVLTLSPTLWWFDCMWQVQFLATEPHTSAIGISLSLLFFNLVSIWGQKREGWEKARGCGTFPLAPRSKLVILTFSAASCDFRPHGQTSYRVAVFPSSQSSPSPLLFMCHYSCPWTSRTSQKGSYFPKWQRATWKLCGKRGASTCQWGHGHEALGAVPGTEQSLNVQWQQLPLPLFLLLMSGL